MLERAKNHLRNPLSAYLGLILVCMLLLAAVVAVLPGCTSQDVTPQAQTSGIVFDENAIEGGWEQMDSEQATPSLSQAQRLKKFSQEGHLSLDVMRAIMSEEKKSDLDKVTFSSEALRKYFPKSYTPQRMQEKILQLLEQWYKRRQQQHER